MIAPSLQYRSIFLLLSAAFLAFGWSLGNEFAFDDTIHIGQSIAEGSTSLFSLPFYPGNLYRPFVSLSYLLTHSVAGLAPFSYHLVNLLLHCACVAALYKFALLFTTSRGALLGALLAAVHPLFTEVVVNVSGRSESLCALGVLISLTIYGNSCSKGERLPTHALLVLFLSALWALFSKESGMVVIPLTMLLTLFGVRLYPHARAVWGENLVRALISQLAALVIYLLLRSAALGGSLWGGVIIDPVDNYLVTLTPLARAWSACALLGKYVSLALFPYSLSPDYSFGLLVPPPTFIEAIFSEWGAYFFLASALLVGGALALYRRRVEGVFVLWFFVAFVVTSNFLFPIGTIFGERLAYLPSMGLLMGVGILLSSLKSTLLRIGLLACVFVFLVVKSVVYARVWINNETLFTSLIISGPESAKAQLNYGMVLREKGALDEAMLYVRRALAIYPAFADAAYGLGLIYFDKKIFSGAEHWFNEALKENPDHLPSMIGAGRAALNSGRVDEAGLSYRNVLTREPLNVEALGALIGLELLQGNKREARRLLERLKTIAPKNPAIPVFERDIG